MWIKTTKKHLVQAEHFKCIAYREHDGWTIAWDAEGEYLLCKGDATDIISAAIMRDQNYLEVNDCE